MTCYVHIWLYILTFSIPHFEPWEVETRSPSRTKVLSACKSLAFVWSKLGEVKSRSCESSRLYSRKFSNIRAPCLSHVDSCPNFDPSVQPGARLVALQLCDARAKKSSPFSKVCFARMRGRDKGRSLLRCLHVTLSSKSQSGY